jgi:selenocysteine lyase/cysteine desulfurase
MNRKNARDFSGLAQYEEDYYEGAKRYDVGETSNFILMSILKEALTQLLEWQPRRIEAYCKKLIQPLKIYLEGFGLEFEAEDYFSSHLFALELPEDVDEELLKENLAIANIYISQRGSMLRVSLNIFNDEGDIKRLIQVIESSRV